MEEDGGDTVDTGWGQDRQPPVHAATAAISHHAGLPLASTAPWMGCSPTSKEHAAILAAAAAAAAAVSTR